MKKYRHKGDGYIVEAEKRPSSRLGVYLVKDYACRGEGDIFLEDKDFNKLFEPVEKYCVLDKARPWQCDMCRATVNPTGDWHHEEDGTLLCAGCYQALYGLSSRRASVWERRAVLKDLVARVRGVDKVAEYVKPDKEYCCDWFRKCIEKKVIRVSTIDRHVWVFDVLDEWFTECPFCKTKL